jgi:3-dehydrosphinganine reductase
MKNLNGKFELITGGSSGIGLALACKLSPRNVGCHSCARSEALDEALEIIEKSRQNPLQKLIAISADVTDAKAIALTLADLKTNHGLPDLLINCAGVAKPGYAELLPLEDFRWMMDIDYHGTVNVTQTLLPDFIARGSGHIVNFSSLAGAVGIFGYTAYCGAKFAVRAIPTRSVRK